MAPTVKPLTRSGFCINGHCEGTKPKSPTGKPMKTCHMWSWCKCKCHADITAMFEMTGTPRILIENPEYKPVKSPFWMPSLEDRVLMAAAAAVSFNSKEPSTPVTIESPAPGVVPGTVARSFAPTATGRAARGELESWVRAVTDEWLVENYDFPCTPAWIGEQIAQKQGIVKPPSSGAIDAVLNRWVEIGFAVKEKKPTRFLRYTEEGVEHGLEAMKLKAKLKKARQRSNMDRGFRDR